MSLAINLLALILGLLIILFRRWVKLYDHWKELGVVHRKPYPFVGNMIDNLLKKKTIGEVFSDIALEFKDNKYIGVYNFITADLMITDPDLIQTVLTKEFSHFIDRGPNFESNRTMDKNLVFLTGAEWKGVRTKVSPAFSSGKLKSMFPLMKQSYDYTSKYLDKLLSEKKDICLKDILEMYLASVSASTIYGIDPSKLADPHSEFKKVLDESSKMSLRTFIGMTLATFFPKLLLFLDFSVLGKHEKFYVDLVLNTFKERTESGTVRDDIIQQLLQLKQTGKIEVSQWAKEDEEELGSEPSTLTETIEITDEILIAQGFIFLMAGFEPMKVTIAMLLVELCSNKQCHDKVIEELMIYNKKYNGLTVQAVKEMEYLDWCISETLRLYTPAEMIMRSCVKNFTLDDGFTIEAGTRILIPLLKLHKDPTYFPEPEKFNPERFQTPPPPWVYIPFGQGPRICIARRFALQEMKVFLATILYDYDISLNSKTKLPVKSDKWSLLRQHSSEIYIDFTKKNH